MNDYDYEEGINYLKNRKMSIHIILFEIRNLYRLGMFKKYRYIQSESDNVKNRKVKEWDIIQAKKNFLKQLYILYYTKNKDQNISVQLFPYLLE